MRPVISQGILWTVYKDGSTAHVEASHIDGVGLEMCYAVNGSPILTKRFDDGPTLLHEASALRFELELEGWIL
jgi:hypothetical protein